MPLFFPPYLKKFHGLNFAVWLKMFLVISGLQQGRAHWKFRNVLMSLFLGITCRRLRGCLLINVKS